MSMHINLISRFEIECTPENQVELEDLLNILRIELTKGKALNPEYMDAINGITKTFKMVAHRSATEGGGGWVRNTVTTDYLNPYWEAAKERYASPRFAVDLTPVMCIATHTHFVERLWDTGTVTYYASVFPCYPYVGETFVSDDAMRARAEKEARGDVAAILGHYHVISEFIEMGNGLFRRNPKWGSTPTTYDPGLDNEKVWRLLSDTWLDKYATAGQKAVLKRSSSVERVPHWAGIRDYQGFYVDGYTKLVTWKEFQAL